MLIKRTFLLTGCRGFCWGGVGGVGWGGGVNVLSSAYSKCCYAAEISGMLATLLRCRDLWNAFYVTCCYAAKISGMLATLHVATLPRSLECLLRYMLLRCRDLWNACYIATLPRSLECLLRCRDLMLYAKMWQWRFVNKYKKLLQKTADMLQKLE